MIDMLITSKRNAIQVAGFSDIDSTGRADEYFAILESAERLPIVIANRERSYQLLDVAAGQTVVDVGCGSGGAVDDLAARGANATGIDASENLIAIARRRFPHRNFRLGAAGSLPFADSSVHAYRAERLYQHLADPTAALAEARRVLVPGGRIVLIDQDYDFWAIDADDTATARAIVAAHAATLVSPWIGRRHRARLLDAGFEDVTVEVNTDVITDYASFKPYLPIIIEASLSTGLLTQA